MNKVTTISICGRCGAQEMRDGANEQLPTGWGTAKLGQGFMRPYLFNDDLCPACQEVVLEALKPPVKEEPELFCGDGAANCEICRKANA